jgi:hypothetical protein
LLTGDSGQNRRKVENIGTGSLVPFTAIDGWFMRAAGQRQTIIQVAAVIQTQDPYTDVNKNQSSKPIR